MIIGYDFWLDGVFYDNESTSVITEDNDGVAFDNCNMLSEVNNFTLTNGTYDELHITKDNVINDNSEQKTDWTTNTVLLAKFQNSLSAGTIGIDGYNIKQIEIKRKKENDDFWQTYFVIDYNKDINIYTIIDKFIESEEKYEYCICPVAVDDTGNKIYGNNTSAQSLYISYDNVHIFDNTDSFDLIYNLKISEITMQIGSNTIETLGSQYPYVIYGKNNYSKGNLEFLLVSEESAVGNVNIASEKALRHRISSFLSNKQHKIFKNSDGMFMIIDIIGTPTLTPLESLGVYQISFEFIQIGDANNINDLSKCNLNFDYYETQDDGTIVKIVKSISGNDNINEYDDVDIKEYIKKQLDERFKSVKQMPQNPQSDVLYLIQDGD